MTNRMDTESLRELKVRLSNLGVRSGYEAIIAIEELEADRDRWKAMAGRLYCRLLVFKGTALWDETDTKDLTAYRNLLEGK